MQTAVPTYSAGAFGSVAAAAAAGASVAGFAGGGCCPASAAPVWPASAAPVMMSNVIETRAATARVRRGRPQPASIRDIEANREESSCGCKRISISLSGEYSVWREFSAAPAGGLGSDVPLIVVHRWRAVARLAFFHGRQPDTSAQRWNR